MSRPETPSWTGGNSSDPGITILELLVYAVAGAIFGGFAYAWLYARRASSGR
jgi:uncharacterized membrane-anchored protein YitT (DUF2179 family)